MGAPVGKAFLKLMAVLLALWGVGQVLSRRLSAGDADADEFTVATFFGGTERKSTSSSLRRGAVIACCGGVDLDLRSAVLDSEGATLAVQATMGGVQVTVPDTWRVIVDADARAGGIETSVTRPEELPDDAPTLHVHAIARMGGVMVTRGGQPETPTENGSGTESAHTAPRSSSA